MAELKLEEANKERDGRSASKGHEKPGKMVKSKSKSDTWARALNNHFHDKFPDKYPFRTKEKVGDKMRS